MGGFRIVIPLLVGFLLPVGSIRSGVSVNANVNKIQVKGNRIRAGEVFQFEALDCDGAHALARYAGRTFCDKQSLMKENGLAEKKPGGVYAVLQKRRAVRFKAMMCEKRVSSISLYCGAFSHTKMIEPPDIMKPERVPRAMCADVADSRILNTEDGRQLKVDLDEEVVYKFTAAGAVTVSGTNANCEGGLVKLGDGKKHDNIVQLVAVQFTLIEVEMTEEDGRLSTEEGRLPRVCGVTYQGCALADRTFSIDVGNVDLCPMQEIRRVDLQMVEHNQRKLGINDEHKILFEMGAATTVPEHCHMEGSMVATNFERVFLMKDPDLTEPASKLDKKEVDMELENRITDFYVEFWALMLNQENLASWQAKLCELSTERLNEEQVILHGNHLLRMKGELVNEFACEKIIVTAPTGFQAEDGCLDHLPVFTPAQELKYLAPLTRLLTQRRAVSRVNCSDNFPVSIQDVQGRMIAANPDVKIVDVELSQYHLQNEGGDNHTELFEVKSLLYTTQEVQDYEQLLVGPSVERVITRQFSSYYCQNTGDCVPSRNTQDFRWDRLLRDPETLLFGWWETTKEWALWWGSVWGCCSFVLSVVSFLTNVMTVLCHAGKTRIDKKTLFKFVFMPGQGLVNLFPPKKAQREEEMRVFRWDTGASAPTM